MNLVKKLIHLFEAERNEEQAIPMKKYMKGQFPFLGIKTPARSQLMKRFNKETGILKEPLQQEFIVSLWEKEEREYQYAALDYIGRSLKKFEKDDLVLMEKLITSKSWWDTIDMLAQKPVGNIAAEFPEVIPETIDGWAFGDEMWLQRSAILFQLKYKDQTDEKLLYTYISQNADSKEFFIQKAIGWALREYSKTNPESVKQFIEKSKLAKLSVREGSKYLNKIASK
ncbi:DNA alkylation repair protein [Virgibacillus necropolis]|uniref:DNA alkylation repair protein n=1 Tax=Virgibacillus necropolis TaxID=163877 RepID=UPI0038510302